MRFGLFLPQRDKADLRRDVTMVAREAEQSGYRSLWAYERVLFPLEPADGLYGMPGVPWPDAYRVTAEPLTVLTLAAAVTGTVRLGTGLLVAGLHAAHQLARTIATLDQATGGRVVLGLGSGWSSDEYRAVGADFAHRGRSLEEMIDACRALWGPDPVTYRDTRMTVSDALVSPKPAGRVPILLGGGTTRTALDRIARKADGWIPAGLPPAAAGARLREIRDLAAGHGRNPAELEMYPQARIVLTDSDAGEDRMPCQGSVRQILADLTAYAEAGATEAMVVLPTADTGDDMVREATTLMRVLTDEGLAD